MKMFEAKIQHFSSPLNLCVSPPLGPVCSVVFGYRGLSLWLSHGSMFHDLTMQSYPVLSQTPTSTQPCMTMISWVIQIWWLIMFLSSCCNMSIKCILPPVIFCAKKHQKKIDDRPFPEDDYKVFPRENLYDRIILPGKNHFGHFVHDNNQGSKLSKIHWI